MSSMGHEAVASGSVAAFEAQWARAQPSAFAYICATVPSHHDASDIMQTVALTALEKFEAYDPTRPFIAWIIGIARFEVLRYLRARGSEKLLLVDDELLIRLAEATERQFVTREPTHDSLAHCIDRLGERARAVLRLRYERGMKTAAIAEQMATSPAYVSTMLNRAYKQLRRCIEKREKQPNLHAT